MAASILTRGHPHPQVSLHRVRIDGSLNGPYSRSAHSGEQKTREDEEKSYEILCVKYPNQVLQTLGLVSFSTLVFKEFVSFPYRIYRYYMLML
jgi:hypothetical protein